MISVVMFGHALLPYVTVPRDFKDAATHFAFDVVAVFLYSFAMQAFFLTAGFSAAALLDRRGARGLLVNRWNRIMVPFLFAWALLAPLTRAAYQFGRETTAETSITAGFERLLQWRWLDWSKVYHLWFLPALLVFTVATFVAYLAWQRLPAPVANRFSSAMRSLLEGPWWIPVFTFLIAMGTVPAYVTGEGAPDPAWVGVALFVFFLFGWILYWHRDLLPTFGNRAWTMITIGVIATLPTAWATVQMRFADGAQSLATGIAAGLGNTVLGVTISLGLLGLYQARLNQPSEPWRYVNDASYWIYLIHMPIVIFVGGLLSQTPFPALVKYLLTVAIALPIVMGTYHFGVQRTALGRALAGGRPR